MLDLSRLAGDEATTVLSGKDRGEQTRADFHIDALDKSPEHVVVQLPPNLDAITPSFVLGMFGQSVKTLGSVDAFFDKYNFDVEPYLFSQIRRGAEYSLVVGTPLPFQLQS